MTEILVTVTEALALVAAVMPAVVPVVVTSRHRPRQMNGGEFLATGILPFFVAVRQ